MGDSPLRDAHKAQEKASNAAATQRWHEERMNFDPSGGKGGGGGGTSGGGRGCLILLFMPMIIAAITIGARSYFS
jgi:hypothetical protein